MCRDFIKYENLKNESIQIRLCHWLVGSWKASYTVEAAFMVPILIGAMVIAMRMGIGCYEEIRLQKEQEKVCTMWEVKEFYRYQTLKEIGDD